MTPPRTNSTTSRDGTTIAYTTTGAGLGLIIVGGPVEPVAAAIEHHLRMP